MANRYEQSFRPRPSQTQGVPPGGDLNAGRANVLFVDLHIEPGSYYQTNELTTQ